MTRHLLWEIEQLKRMILSLSTLVEENLRRAVKAVEDKDSILAEQAIDGDKEIDRMEVRVEEECLKLLALHQPVAFDLRFIVSVLKINRELERIGDLATNIAERVSVLAARKNISITFDFPGMTEKTQNMLRLSLDSLVKLDSSLARSVLPLDDEVDEIHRGMYGLVKEGIQNNQDIDVLIHLLMISRHLERIADHAVNIAKDVIYLVEAEIVRHKGSIWKSSNSGNSEP